MHIKDSKVQLDERSQVHKVLFGRGGHGDFMAMLLENGEICMFDNDLQYVGSYHFLNVKSIIEIVCNESYQFIGVLCDNNSM